MPPHWSRSWPFWRLCQCLVRFNVGVTNDQSIYFPNDNINLTATHPVEYDRVPSYASEDSFMATLLQTDVTRTDFGSLPSNGPDDQTFEDIDFVKMPPADVFAFNELRSCADLYRMCREQQIEIRPHFQREFVWKNPAQTRFIDSLAKNLPIPSMCFSMDFHTGNWQVIDGQQRMSTIVKFFTGNWTLSPLPDVDDLLSGATLPDFSKGADEGNPDLRRIIRQIENTSLPITVLRCNTRDRNHMEYIFTIFHRLNTGGTKLNNQEIRNGIFSGRFNDLLNELDGEPRWLAINDSSARKLSRFRGQEIILRFFALHDGIQNYKNSLVKFLNDYMFENRYQCNAFLDKKRQLFLQTVETVWGKVLGEAYPGRLPVSVLEALLVGVATNLDSITAGSAEDARARFESLLQSDAFSDEALSSGLARKEKVEARISTAIRAFADPMS